MNRHFDIAGQEANASHEIKNIGQPRRLVSERSKIDDGLQMSEQEFYDELKARHKYNRSERKDLIRMAKKIYVQ